MTDGQKVQVFGMALAQVSLVMILVSQVAACAWARDGGANSPTAGLLTASQLARSLRAIRNPSSLSVEIYYGNDKTTAMPGPPHAVEGGEHCSIVDPGEVTRLATMMSEIEVAPTDIRNFSGSNVYNVEIAFKRLGKPILVGIFPDVGAEGLERSGTVNGLINDQVGDFRAAAVSDLTGYVFKRIKLEQTCLKS